MSLRRCLLVVLVAPLFAGPVLAADEPWPERVVTIEQMKATKPLRVKVFKPNETEKGVSTVVLHVHVSETGQVVRSRLEQSSGNPNLDEAVLHGMRVAEFVPYQVDGVPTAVTMVALTRFPFVEKKRR